jgi:hypothetical protein
MPFGRKMQLKLKIWACFRKSHKTTKPYFCLTFTFISGQNSDLFVNFWLNLHSLLKTFESEKEKHAYPGLKTPLNIADFLMTKQ